MSPLFLHPSLAAFTFNSYELCNLKDTDSESENSQQFDTSGSSFSKSVSGCLSRKTSGSENQLLSNEVQFSEKYAPPISSACNVNFVNPKIVKSMLKFSILPIYSERQLRETLTDARLKANITAFCLSNYVPQGYIFVFANLE